MEHLLTLQNLHVSYHTPRGTVQAVRGVDLTLDSGEVLAVVGESGCGKSALLKAIMRLLPENASVTGKILVNSTDIAPYSEKQLQKLRGSLFSMVFQDPMTALNPSMTIGSQIAEAIVVHEPTISKEALRARVLELMELVEIDRPLDRMKLYPHNFSGGMRQRAVMAIALAARAKILLADEPTTALDVTIQAQILDLLRDLQKKLHTATILVSHDLGVAQLAVGDTIVVDGKDMVVASREDEDGFVTINGGLEQGGVDLTSDDSGVYYAVGMDDAKSYHELGRITVPVAEGFVLTDNSDLEHPDETYAASDLAKLAASEPGFTANNTLATIEHGELTVLARSYTP